MAKKTKISNPELKLFSVGTEDDVYRVITKAEAIERLEKSIDFCRRYINATKKIVNDIKNDRYNENIAESFTDLSPLDDGFHDIELLISPVNEDTFDNLFENIANKEINEIKKEIKSNGFAQRYNGKVTIAYANISNDKTRAFMDGFNFRNEFTLGIAFIAYTGDKPMIFCGEKLDVISYLSSVQPK